MFKYYEYAYMNVYICIYIYIYMYIFLIGHSLFRYCLSGWANVYYF